jgi:hypothetical protein
MGSTIRSTEGNEEVMDGPDRERGVGLRVPDLECRTSARSNFALKMVPAKEGFCAGSYEAGW